jgi:hypothetical protein
MRHIALILLFSVLTGCAARSYYVRVAEGLTSPTMDEAMRVAPRMFSAYQISEACRMPRRIDRLEAPQRTVALALGDELALSTLRIVAISDGNVAVPGVPIVIEAEELNPSVVQLRSDDPSIDQGRLKTVGSGTFRMRVRTLCAATNAEMTITGVVGR